MGVNFALLWSLIWWLRRDGSRRRSPLSRNLLRNPGDSLRPEIEDLNQDFLGLACLLVIVPLAVYSIWISQIKFGAARITSASIVWLGVVTLGAVAFLSVKLFRVLKRRRTLYLALDGEMAIGQELNELMRKGYAVYHDFPAERFNIDHVVVAPGDVFAIETKARPKPITGNAKADAEVTYNGRTLRFPGWESSDFLDQATRQATWLSRWLSSAIGEVVQVKPVLALPGWYINRTKRGPVQVMSGRDANSLVHPMAVRLSSKRHAFR